VTVCELENYARALRADPRFHPDFLVADLRKIERLDLSPDEFPPLADKIDPFSFEAKRALVVRDRCNVMRRACVGFCGRREISRSSVRQKRRNQWLQV
jgi:hypothetical protein